jgi:excisionase family DNA binding protein
MSPEKKFMTLEDVADLLGVNYQLIYRLVRSGELPAIRLGRVYRVTQDDLNTYLTNQKTGAAGSTCEACGTLYKSAESVQQACESCGAPICFDCWQRTGTRLCKACSAADNPQKKTKRGK